MYHFIIGVSAARNRSQFSGIVVVISYCPTPANALVRVGLLVGNCIYYPCRARTGQFGNGRPVNIHRIVLHYVNPRPAGVVYAVNMYRLPGIALYFLRARPGYIRTVIINVGIINDGGIMYNGYRPAWRHIIIINIGAVYVAFRCANPVIIGHIIATAK